MRPEIVLSADDYDALELMAHAHGGIGRGSDWVGPTPCCIHGMAMDLDLGEGSLTGSLLSARLHKAGIWRATNDGTVQSYQKQHKLRNNARMPFEAYVEALNIKRGA